MPDLDSTLAAIDAAPKHCHGIDCCWDCFHGRCVHPRNTGDYDCARELAEFGDAALRQGCRQGADDG